MKSLVTGVFIIIVLGVIFFAFQFVGNREFANVTKVTETAPKDKETFIDINRNISFDYPKGWIMHDPAKVPGYAPVLKTKGQEDTNDIGYIALAREALKRNENIASDIEIYSSELPIEKTLLTLAGTSSVATIDINIEEIKRLTYKSGLSGFIVSYTAKSGNKNFDGGVYFYYTQNGLEYGFSTYIHDDILPNPDSDQVNAMLLESKTSAGNFLNQAHESLINISSY